MTLVPYVRSNLQPYISDYSYDVSLPAGARRKVCEGEFSLHATSTTVGFLLISFDQRRKDSVCYEEANLDSFSLPVG
jgi:hypothetical protein